MTTLKTIKRSGLSVTLFAVVAVSAATMAMAVRDDGLKTTTQHGAADDPMEPRVVDQQAARSAIEHATTTTFESQVLRSRMPVLVDFYADWCGPCQIQAPILDEFAAESSGVKIVKVDVDESPELAASYDVEGLPTLLIFKDGQLATRQVGVATKQQLEAALAD